MRPVSLRQLQRVMPTADPAAFAAVRRRVLGIRTPEQTAELPLAVQLRLLFWDWLRHLGFLADDQVHKLAADPKLDETAALLEACWAGDVLRAVDLPVIQFALYDHRYGRWSGRSGFQDLVDDEPAAELPAPAVTVIVCDLTALYVRALHRLQRLEEPKPC